MSEREDPTFGVFGHKQHTLKCDVCDFTTTRKFVPGQGYEG